MNKLTVIDRTFGRDTRLIASPKRDRFQRTVVLRIDTCRLVLRCPLPPAIPVFEKEPGQYFEARVYVTYGGAERNPRHKPEFFDSEEKRTAYINQRIKEFEDYQRKRK